MTTQEFIAIRKGLGLSQRQLAQALKYDPSYLSRVEHGKQPVSQQLTMAILRLEGHTVCAMCGHPLEATNGGTHR